MNKHRGRLIAIEALADGSSRLLLRTSSGNTTCVAAIEGAADRIPGTGDLVEVSQTVSGKAAVKILTPNRTPERRHRWLDRTLDPRRLHATAVRLKIESAIREYFSGREFLETRTPLLVPCPGMEPHIRPFRLEGGAYLPTSPEFAMKRLLAGGLERIFQICPAFRLEPNSSTHHPEFTMLEWYRAYAGYEEVMADVEGLFAFIGRKLFGEPVLHFQGRRIDLTPPWPRLTVRGLFMRELGIDLVTCETADKMRAECTRLGLTSDPADTWDDLYFRIWLNLLEPALPQDRAVLVTRYPASQAALSVIDEDADGSRWAKRFEAYAGGLELGNAFEELTDPVEQRRRFNEDMELRARLYGPSFPKSPLDEGFLDALTEGMPPSAGIAMGVDRMVMLFADEADIDRTLWLPSFSP